ncbi:MFS transporter [Gordonia sp. DT30]|uniref:MFS transporter n=1 Tax=Gordonia sp. DT30 TaxID=3416546 RepID=UPI003CF91677
MRGLTDNRRFIIAFGLLLIITLGYIDRVNMSVAAPHIIDQFDLSTGQFGLITSVFNWAYIVFLVPVGMMADRWGARLILPISIIVWSLGAGLTGGALGLTMLVIARLLLGAGESSVYPVGNLVVREWAPSKERGIFTGMLNAGALVGPAVGAVIAAYLIAAWGWRASFFILGAAGILVGIVWSIVYTTPEKSRWLTNTERQFILENRDSPITPDGAAKLSVVALLRMRTIWGLMITQGCAVYTNYLFLSFLPLYLTTEKGLKDVGSGWVTGITYGIAAVGSVGIAYISDRAVKNTDVLSGSRRKIVSLTLLLGLPLLALPWVGNFALVVILISWILLVITAAITLNFALAGDLTTDKSSGGRVFALVTFGGNLFGLLAPIITGYLVDWTSGYTAPFLVAGVLLLIGSFTSRYLSNRPLQRSEVAA